MPIEVLFALAITFVVVTLVGHGIWVLLATIFRALLGVETSETAARDCPSCNARKAVYAGQCRKCGATPFIRPVTRPTPEDETALVVARLRDLVATGRLPLAEFRRLTQLICDEAQLPLPGPAAAASAAVPEPSSATENLPAADDALAAGAAAPPPPVKSIDGEEFVEVEIVEAEEIDEQLAGAPPVAFREASPFATAPSAASSGEASPGTASSGVGTPPLMHPLDRPEPARVPAQASAPRRTLAALLQAFMEAKNIRWGEIISGLLIIVCAVGLVVSLWATLRDSIPYLPALIFMVGTAAFHAVGHYTLRSWDLRSVSRAVLIIATLLIPLNFLAAIALSGNSKDQPAGIDPAYLAAVALGLIAYGTMTFFAGRVFLRSDRWRLLAGVMGPCAGQLLINRLADADVSSPRVVALMALPIAGFLLATVSGLWRARSWRCLSLPRVEPLLLVLSMATFSLFCAMALLVAKSETIWDMLARLSPALSLVAGTILASGLLIHQRTTAGKLYGLRMSGTSLAMVASFGLAICILLAWPHPQLLIAVGTTNAILLGSLGFLVSLPALHGFAVVCGALAWIVAFHYFSDSYPHPTRWGSEIARSFITGQTAAWLGVFAAVIGGLGVALNRAKLRRDARGYLLGAAGTLVASALLAAIVGFLRLPSSYLAPPTLLVYAVAVSVAARFVGDGRIAWAGSAVLLVALVQALAFVDFYRAIAIGRGIELDRPILMALLAHSLVCLVVGAGAGRLAAWRAGFDRQSPRWSTLVRPFTESALVTSLLAAPAAALVLDFQFGFHANCTAAIAIVWLGVAVIRRWPVATVVAQSVATISLVFGVAAQRHVGSWSDLFHPRQIAVTLLALAAWCLFAAVGRWSCRRWPHVHELLECPPWPTVDRVTVGLLIALTLGTVSLACVPGMLSELGMVSQAADLAALGQLQAFDMWMWAAWVAVAAALILALWERVTPLGIEALLVASATVPFLIAGPHELNHASLSALRWSLALFGMVAAVCWSARSSMYRLARRRAEWPGLSEAGERLPSTVPLLIVTLAAIPVVVATTLTVMQVVSGVALGGPTAGSFFARIGTAWSYGTPLAVVAATLLVIAVRDARPLYALGGSVVIQYLASLACLLPPLTAGRELTGVDVARLGQWNALALGGYAVVWLALRKWIEPSDGSARVEPSNPFLLLEARSWIGIRVQVVLAIGAVAGLACAAAGGIIVNPDNIPQPYQQLGHWGSFLALALAVVSVVWLQRGKLIDDTPHVVSGAGFCLTAFVASATAPSNLPTNWLSFHVLMVGWTLLVVSAVSELWWPRRISRATDLEGSTCGKVKNLIGWSCAVGMLVSAMSVFSAAQDPMGPWWALGVAFTLALAAAAAGLRVRSHALAYASTVLLAATVTYLWLGTTLITGAGEVLRLIDWWILALALGAGFWLAVEIFWQQRREESFQRSNIALPAHRFFAAVGLLGLLATTVFGAAVGALLRGPRNRPTGVDPSTWWGLAAILAMGLLLFALLWDRRARLAVLSVYFWGIAALAMAVDALQWRLDNTILTAAVSASAYVAFTGILWRRGANLAAMGMRLGISDPVAGLRRTSAWLPVLSVLASGFALLFAWGLVLGHPDRPQRVMTAAIPVLIAIGIACLAQADRKQKFQFGALVMLGAGCVFLSWADIEPSFKGADWLSRVIRLLIVCCAVSFTYTMIVARRRDLSPDWQMSLKRVGLTAGVSALAVLASVLFIETLLYLDNPTRGAPISDIQLAAVSVVMVGLVAALIVMAVLPGRDPLGATERGRMGYVYAAQVAGALLFAHIYLTRPQWFGQWAEFWPYIILLIAFGGAGIGELFQRTGHRVLAEPLQRTGTFLPLLPAIGMWFVGSNSDYSLFLFGAGILYVGLSVGRKSLANGLAAVVAANGALWSLLDDRGFELLGQPQLWLIPPALSVLIAAEINRKRLPESAITGVRYACMMVIYLSSAGEIFIRGIGQALWPPMVLLLLSLFGAMAGIVLRIRAFLYLGVTFIVLSMISMVWHAARSINHVWPWWAFGIGMGLCILIFFGFFEKNRDKITATVDRLKQWEP